MASSDYSSRSLLPWQPPILIDPTATEQYTLPLANGTPGPLLYSLYLWCDATSGRWHWRIYAYNPVRHVAESRPAGYTRPRNAERALLAALHAHMHPAASLPASLPPCEGAISATRRGE